MILAINTAADWAVCIFVFSLKDTGLEGLAPSNPPLTN